MRYFCLCLFLTLSLSQEDATCLDNPNGEGCREQDQEEGWQVLPSPTTYNDEEVPAVTKEMRKPKTKEPHKTALQTSDAPLELLSVVRAFTEEQIYPLSATALMSIRMPRNVAVVMLSSNDNKRPQKRLYLQLLLQASAGRLVVLDALEGTVLLDTTSALQILMMKAVADRLAIAYEDYSIRIFKVVGMGEESESPKKKKIAKLESVTPPKLFVKLEPEAEIPAYVRSRLDPEGELPDAAATLAEVPARLTAMSLQVVKGRLHWLLGGYENGMVASFTKEGFVKTETPTNHSVVGFTAGQGSLVVTINEQGYGLVRVSSRTSSVSMFCGHTANGTVIRAVAYDPMQNSVLYAVTQKGRLLVFNTKASRDLHVYCQPKHSVVVEDGSPLNIVATKGFLFLTSRSALYIFNTTNMRVREPPTFTLRRAFFGDSAPLPSFTPPTELQPPLALNILLRDTNDEYVEVSQLSSGESVIFASHLPFVDDSKGSTMFRLPILLGGIVAMGFFQIYKKRKAAPALNDPMMRELREIGQRGRPDPRGVRDIKSNRRFGLTAGKKMPVRAPVRPVSRPDDGGSGSDPEDMLSRGRPRSDED